MLLEVLCFVALSHAEPSFSDLPTLWSLYRAIGRQDVVRTEMLERVNKFMLAFERLPTEVQRSAELRLIDASAKEAEEEVGDDKGTGYHKLDLLRVWMGKAPILQPDIFWFRWSFLVMAPDHRIVEGERPHLRGTGAPISIRFFVKEAADRAREHVLRGDFILPTVK